MIWVIGKNGMLGSEIVSQLSEHKIPFVATGREVDATNADALEKFLAETERNYYLHATKKNKIQWIINCSGYTAVEQAETETEAAHLLNVTAPRNIARAARNHGAKLVHFSSDYVFGKTQSAETENVASPFCEDDKKSPLGIYGKTKSEGEDIIQKEMAQYYILRTAWLYGFCGKNFVYTMTRLMNEKDSIKVVNDQYGTPTNASDLARVTIELVQKSDSAKNIIKDMPPYGIYHFTNEGQTTWFDFAQKIYSLGKKYDRIKNECEILPCSTDEYGAKVTRPNYSVLSKEKIKQELKIKIPSWETSLASFISDSKFDIK